jgi:FkbM family methyltransferase
MTSLAAGRLVDLAKISARRFGVELGRYSPTRSAEARRARILATDRIDLVLDVGANSGQYGRQLRRSGYGGRIVSFEPQSEAFRTLLTTSASDARWRCLQLALGKGTGNARLQVGESSLTSSLLSLEPHLMHVCGWSRVSEETVAVSTLDSLADDLIARDARAFLKVDTEGSELDVLTGGDRMLRRLQGVEVELHLVPHFEGQPDYREVVNHLEDRGFRLTSLDCGWADPNTGRVHYADAIFVPEAGTNGAR